MYTTCNMNLYIRIILCRVALTGESSHNIVDVILFRSLWVMILDLLDYITYFVSKNHLIIIFSDINKQPHRDKYTYFRTLIWFILKHDAPYWNIEDSFIIMKTAYTAPRCCLFNYSYARKFHYILACGQQALHRHTKKSIFGTPSITRNNIINASG